MIRQPDCVLESGGNQLRERASELALIYVPHQWALNEHRAARDQRPALTAGRMVRRRPTDMVRAAPY